MRINPSISIEKAVRSLQPGEPLLLAPGIYKSASLANLPNLTIIGDAPSPAQVIISGGSSALKLSNCPYPQIRNLTFEKAQHSGLLIVSCISPRIARIIARNNGASGILTSNSSAVDPSSSPVIPNLSSPSYPTIEPTRAPGLTTFPSIEQCECYQNAEHGIYLSQSGDNLTISSNFCHHNERCGIQVNANEPRSSTNPADPSHDAISRNILISGNILSFNQIPRNHFSKRPTKSPPPGSAINLASVRDSSILNNQILQHYGRNGIALWDDATNNRERACHNLTISGNIFSFAYPPNLPLYPVLISISANCSDIRASDPSYPPNRLALPHETEP